MVKTYNYPSIKRTRLGVKHSLVFFLLAILMACTSSPQPKIELVWNDERAVAIEVPKHLVSNNDKLNIKLKGSLVSILGNVKEADNVTVFTPAIPFSSGLSYEVFDGDKLIGIVDVPADKSEAPKLIAIYPQADTLPENLLKIYLRFSKPMRTGQVLNHVVLLDQSLDTMRNVFLDLQPELWDSTGTVLTLWLDPGRIKRDLVLNRQLGNPLKKEKHYQLVISDKWKDTYGNALGKSNIKNFTAGHRVDEVIDINKWSLTSPKQGTTDALIVNTGRYLDHYLLKESVWVIGPNGKPLDGTLSISDTNKDRVWQFKPLEKWQNKTYRIKVNTRLEDLAGNNLNKVFDRDIYKQAKKNDVHAFRNFDVGR